MRFRRATPADATVMVETLTDAFHHDPIWSWAFPDPVARPNQYRRWWRLFVDGALRYDASWLADDGAAVAVWLPPGGSELSDEQAVMVEPLLRELVGPHADAVLELFHRFDEVHPNHEPHYYLTLLGTRSDRRGAGVGMALLRHCLDEWDAQAVPSYLESSNPGNDRRYEALGYARIGEFRAPDGPVVASMWRAAARQ